MFASNPSASKAVTYRRSNGTFWTSGNGDDFALPVIQEIGLEYVHEAYPKNLSYSKPGSYYADGFIPEPD